MDLHLSLDSDSIGNAENPRPKKLRGVKYHKPSVKGTPRRSLRAHEAIPEYTKSSIKISARRTCATMCSPLSAQQNHSPFDSEHPTRTTNRLHMSSLGKASGMQSGSNAASTRSVTHDRTSSSASPPLFTAASNGLSRVRQQLERETARLGRNLSIMDFVLDSRSPWVDFSVEMILEIAIRSHLYSPSRRREYGFGDEHSFKAYWDEEAMI
ncbi:uncharacterized protein BT62DRAFT_775847 [Guyanagaster necrorhizus]|uniref:Uncharacterized protein n=1 Tax=Guyanagaster necrorhizus TaxID=856835 RepID=A0A9P8ATI3_9AGAR|nr:uncharacterized protein BT62DRAFT_775847 [Guyanagaster necrorhizus MCA 3950]KAG7447468.1 hypothetical protein BT62DRAFT_775847 [Guyanagaster necrorhizus MCA 3950]